jgi:hypothetical protein
MGSLDYSQMVGNTGANPLERVVAYRKEVSIPE